MNTCFQSLFSLPIRLLELLDLKLKLIFFFLRWDLKRCRMQTSDLDKLTFISKN
jgi:hypothetical protein